MKKNTSLGAMIAGSAMLVLAAHFSPELFAQNPFSAPTGAIDTLSGGAVPSGGRAVQAARSGPTMQPRTDLRLRSPLRRGR